MVTWILSVGWVAFAGVALGALALVVTFVHERQWRAVRVAACLFLPVLVLFGALLLVGFPGRLWVLLGLLVLGGVAVLLLGLPTGFPPQMRVRGEQRRVDERDVVFHRFYRLVPGTPEYEEYYRAHPEQAEFDEKVRALPKLGHPGTNIYDPLASPFQVATFDVLEEITRELDWVPDPFEESPVRGPPEEFTRRLKGFARYLGADLVGTTRLNPAYVYSHVGRSPGKVGEPIVLSHSHALAFAVEMSHDMVRQAPDSATTTESAFKYFEAAKIALLTARYVNLLGYEARAHVDGNYRVMCGPVAVDAGLGELGRLGLLITPKYGPRVRLSVVTTNLPLLQDEPIHFGAQHFCDFCKKCAANCPSRAIDLGDKAVHNGVEKWQSDQEACYRFWRVQGSDCALCMKVCPYSHPDTPVHTLVRWAIRRSSLARRAALRGDDLFYGRRPGSRPDLPDWHARSWVDPALEAPGCRLVGPAILRVTAHPGGQPMGDRFDEYRDELSKEDIAEVPEHLRDLVPLALKWGIGDDEARSEFEEQMSDAEKHELQNTLRGRTAAVTAWLDEAQAQTPAPYASCPMTRMLEALDEMGLWPD